MTDRTTTVYPTSQTTPGSALVPAAEGTTLITEEQVLLLTAAAVALPAVRTRRWATAIKSVLKAMSAPFTDSRPPAEHYVPKRYIFLEDALMGREMDRL